MDIDRLETGPQDAVLDLSRKLQFGRFSHIVEADVRCFFDNINHNWTIRMLEERINDRAFLRLIWGKLRLPGKGLIEVRLIGFRFPKSKEYRWYATNLPDGMLLAE